MLDSQQAIIRGAELMEEKGLQEDDAVIKRGRLNCTPGHVISATEDGDKFIIRGIISKTISVTEEVEIIVGKDDSIEINPVG